MAGRREIQQDTAETFQIERQWWEIWFLRRSFPIYVLIRPILEQYVGRESDKVRAILIRSLNKQEVRQRLISEIERLNNIQDVIPRDINSIKIPPVIDFIRAVFPEFGILNNAEGPIRVNSSCGGVLDKFGFDAELEEFVIDKNLPANSLSDNALGLIRNALHDFKIYTAFSVRDPQLRDAIGVFRREYIGQPNSHCTGDIDWIMVLLMNQALREEWHREPFFQGIVPRNSSFQNINPRYVINDPAILRANRLPQNAIDPADPWGPCFMRVLQSAAEEFVNMNLNQSQIQASVGALVGGNNNFAVILNSSNRYFVNRHTDVVNDALQRLGYGNVQVISNSERRLLPHTGTLPADIDLTMRDVLLSSGQHFQLGDRHGNFLWEPFPFNNPDNIHTGSFENIRIVRFIITNK